MPKVYLSPSDQSRNTYAAGGTNEQEQCRRISTALETALLRCGFQVLNGLTGSMQERVNESNAWEADLHLPIHTNAYNGQVSGTRIFSYDLSGEGYRAAQSVFAALAPVTPGNSESITPRPELYEVRASNAPCVYVEVDFHDVAEVALWIIRNTIPIAEAICRGICNYFGVIYEDGEEELEMRYNTLGDLKNDQNNAPYYLPTIEKLLAKGFLTGKGGEGDGLILDLSEDAVRILVIHDRAGLYGD